MPSAASRRLELRLPLPPLPGIPRHGPQRPPLAQFVVLSILVHALLILTFGSPTGGSPAGRSSWGTLDVRIHGSLLGESAGPGRTPALPLPGAEMLEKRERDREAARLRPPAPVTKAPPTEPDLDAARVAPVKVPPPMSLPEPIVPAAADLSPAPAVKALPMMSVPAPRPVQVPRTSTPTPMAKAPPVPETPRMREAPVIPMPMEVPSAQATPAMREPPVIPAPLEAPALPATPRLREAPVIPLPMEVPAVPAPPRLREMPVVPMPLEAPAVPAAPRMREVPLIPAPMDVPAAPATPRLREMPVIPMPLEAPAAPAAPRLRETPVIRAPLEVPAVPAVPRMLQAPTLPPVVEVPAIPTPPPLTRMPAIPTAPPMLGAPAITAPAPLPDRVPGAPSDSVPSRPSGTTPGTRDDPGSRPDSPIFDNLRKPPTDAPIPGLGPRIDLEAAKARAREVAREGMGNRAILPFPMPPLPERKSKEELAIEKGWKPDCRDAYKDLGLLAVVPLIANEFGEGKCRW